jgi:enoyl-CoA hydratase/carnithine racemase
MGEPEVLVNRDEPAITQLILNRPGELNAWTYSLEAALFDALDAAASDPAVRIVVITGAGRAFCAGASMSLLGDTGAPVTRPDRKLRRRLSEIATFPKPVVAAINGAAAGIGFALAIACDIRFAAADAKMTTSFARLALVAEHGVAWLLPRLIGWTHATDLLLSGRTISGTEAAEIGLVSSAVSEMTALTRALDYAREMISTGSPESWAAIKRQLHEADRTTLAEAYERAADLMEIALSSADHREGVRAFRERRAPNFRPVTPPNNANTPVDGIR